MGKNKYHERITQDILTEWTQEEREELLKRAFDTNYDEEEARKRAVKLSSLSDCMEKILDDSDAEGRIVGLKTGYWQLDRMTAGLGNGELIIIFGATSRGKSMLSQNMLAYQIATGHKSLYITLEMEDYRLGRRLRAIYGDDIFLEVAERDTLRMQACKGGLDYQAIKYYVEAAKAWGAEICYVDHLHYFPTSGQNQAEELGIITKEMKRIATQFEIPLVLMAHTRRMEDEWTEPESTDIRGSSLIEQHADISLAIWQEHPDVEPREHIWVSLKKNRNRAIWRRLSRQKFFRSGVRILTSPYDESWDAANDITGKARGKET